MTGGQFSFSFFPLERFFNFYDSFLKTARANGKYGVLVIGRNRIFQTYSQRVYAYLFSYHIQLRFNTPA